MNKSSKTKKRKAFISIALALALTITGALAFLTARDSAENKFTVGNVDIELTEPNWDENNAKDIVSGQIIEKDPTITNTGRNDAYVYMMVEIPKDTKTTEDFYPLFSFTANEGWTLIDSKLNDNSDTNDYYLYGHDTSLAPGDAATLFNEVTFANVTSDFVDTYAQDGISSFDIKVTGYAIQSDFYNSEASDATAAWELYATQNGWAFPINLVGPHYSLVGYSGAPKTDIAYASDAEIITLPHAVSTSFDNCEFAGWTSDSGMFYSSDEEVSISSLFVKDSDGNVLNPNPILTEKVSTTKSNDNADIETALPVKLMPKNDTCNTIIDRGVMAVDSRNAINFVNDFATYTESNSDVTNKDGSRLYGEPTTEYPYTVADDETFETWFVYGLDERITLDDLFESYVRVQGDGYAKITSSLSNIAGTGTLIEVFDRNGTEETTDDTLVEKFHVVIFGDLDGDAEVTISDFCICEDETVGADGGWSLVRFPDKRIAYKVRAASLNGDNRVNTADASLFMGVLKAKGIDYIFNRPNTNNRYVINQITGYAESYPTLTIKYTIEGGDGTVKTYHRLNIDVGTAITEGYVKSVIEENLGYTNITIQSCDYTDSAEIGMTYIATVVCS